MWLVVTAFETGEHMWGVLEQMQRPTWGQVTTGADSLEAAMADAEQEAEHRARATLEALGVSSPASERRFRAERQAWRRQQSAIARAFPPLLRASHDLAAVLGGNAQDVDGAELLALAEFVAALAAKVRALPLGGS